DANPYIVLAAILGAALHGITAQTEAPAPETSNSHATHRPAIARDWHQALEWLGTSSHATRILDPEFIAAFAACKHQEQAVFADRVTDFELQTYRLSV